MNNLVLIAWTAALLIAPGILSARSEDSTRIENVSFSLNKGIANVVYDLIGDPEAEFDIRVEVRRDGAPGFGFTLKDATGSVGQGQRAGRRKLIVWNPSQMMKNWPDAADYYFEINAIRTDGGLGVWPWIGGAAAVGGVVTYFILRGPGKEITKETPDAFPDPPPRP
jgi:hypothetical protein